MRPTRILALLVAAMVAFSWVSCGGTSVDGTVGPTGGSVCLPDNKVCIIVPIGALETQEVLRISPGNDVPGAALSDGYEISAASGRPIDFVKPATVTFSLEIVRQGDLQNENLLRIYTRDRSDGAEGEWQPLENTFVDRVRNEVRGDTRHLSPFAVLRSDRLPDGGLPFEIDAGPLDASVIVVPPFDAGPPDAGRDAGLPDAGPRDAGPPDAGPRDAGPPDAGPPDAGPPDAGPPDAGPPDAGPPDAGPPDAGFDAGVDAGEPDAGEPDAGEPDAGEPDAGEPDAGEPDAGEPDAGDDAGTDAG